MNTMLEDTRMIKSVFYNDADGGLHEVGLFGCTKIEVYGENGPYCSLPFVAIWHGDEIKHRIPAGMVQITYANIAER